MTNNPEELALSTNAAANPAANEFQNILAIIERAAKDESVDIDKMERLLALAERMQAKDAEKQFAKAFNALQSHLPRFTAGKEVPDKNGNLKYRFAPFEDIMTGLKPLLVEFGFTVTFSMTFAEGRVIQTCTVQHLGGHARANSFAARVGHGPPGASETQADGAASTYAKRFALCNAFNIIIENDTDGASDVRQEGEVITPGQIQYLREQLRESGFNEATFWTLAGAEKFEDIREGSYPVLVRAMEMKRNAKKS